MFFSAEEGDHDTQYLRYTSVYSGPVSEELDRKTYINREACILISAKNALSTSIKNQSRIYRGSILQRIINEQENDAILPMIMCSDPLIGYMLATDGNGQHR